MIVDKLLGLFELSSMMMGKIDFYDKSDRESEVHRIASFRSELRLRREWFGLGNRDCADRSTSGT
jgi:hypothetical protein